MQLRYGYFFPAWIGFHRGYTGFRHCIALQELLNNPLNARWSDTPAAFCSLARNEILPQQVQRHDPSAQGGAGIVALYFIAKVRGILQIPIPYYLKC